jgi:DnaK suppressor protein
MNTGLFLGSWPLNRLKTRRTSRMPSKVKVKKKATPVKAAKVNAKRPAAKKVAASDKPLKARTEQQPQPKERPKTKYQNSARREGLYRMLTAKRQEILKQIEEVIGQSLTDDQQRRLESARDIGDQALMDLERELGISLLEMQNRKRQSIDEALRRLAEGSYGLCANCGVEISEKRLAAVPFAKLCVDCQAKEELLEKIEKEEERE